MLTTALILAALAAVGILANDVAQNRFERDLERRRESFRRMESARQREVMDNQRAAMRRSASDIL